MNNINNKIKRKIKEEHMLRLRKINKNIVEEEQKIAAPLYNILLNRWITSLHYPKAAVEWHIFGVDRYDCFVELIGIDILEIQKKRDKI